MPLIGVLGIHDRARDAARDHMQRAVIVTNHRGAAAGAAAAGQLGEYLLQQSHFVRIPTAASATYGRYFASAAAPLICGGAAAHRKKPRATCRIARGERPCGPPHPAAHGPGEARVAESSESRLRGPASLGQQERPPRRRACLRGEEGAGLFDCAGTDGLGGSAVPPRRHRQRARRRHNQERNQTPVRAGPRGAPKPREQAGGAPPPAGRPAACRPVGRPGRLVPANKAQEGFVGPKRRGLWGPAHGPPP